ncbi:MAG TPA: NADP-dependent isocitrate dehydrogenase, partial [Candidatus Brevibacterium intestinigallinarum]|nr:NADP-dependent isocitrate dehydrogenase [Candidatus Brevibacterium intestinigallinarum]
RKVNEIDNRGSHFYLALYWAEELAKQTDDQPLAEAIAPVAKALRENEDAITRELISVQGREVDLGGYYNPSDELADAVMRPSQKLNEIIATLG